MSLLQDMDALQRHIDNGTAAEFMAGTAPILPMEKLSDIRDPSVPAHPNTYVFIKQRGD